MRSYKAKAQVNWKWDKAGAGGGQQRLRTRHRVLIVDTDSIFARRLSDYMWDHGFEARAVKTADEAKELLEFWRPDSAFIDLHLPKSTALTLLKSLQTSTFLKPKIIVTAKQAIANGIEQMRKAGASHYLVKPFSLEEAFRAVETESVERRQDRPAPALTQSPSAIKELHLINLFLKQASQGRASDARLYNLMRMINMKAQALRTSLIRCVNEQTGMVMASNDDESIQGLRLELKNYPELLEVRRSGQPVVISNVRTSDIVAPVKAQLGKTPFETLVLFPVFRDGDFYGVLSVRLVQKEPLEIFYIEKFGAVCSQIISLSISAQAA